MSKTVFICAAVCLLALSGCGNTVRGIRQDGVQTSNALDNASGSIAAANAN